MSTKTKGRLTVECRQSDGANVASELYASYPLRLHVPSNHHQFSRQDQTPKALCCYLLGYGGGLVSGDDIELELQVKQGASLVVTSQSTAKAFRARSDRSRTRVTTTATVQGFLVWVPQPTQCFQHSKLTQTNHVTMYPGASLLLLDWYTGGRLQLDHGGWQMDSLETITTLAYPKDTDTDGGATSPIFFRDASLLSGGLALQRHMRHFQVVAMVVLVGPKVQALAQQFLQLFASRNSYSVERQQQQSSSSSSVGVVGCNKDDGLLISCGAFPTVKGQADGVILRILANSVEQAALFLSKHIGTLDGQLEADPFLEILVSRIGTTSSPTPSSTSIHPVRPDNQLSLDMIKHSLSRDDDPATIANLIQVPPAVMERKIIATKSIRPSVLYQLVDSSAPTGGFAHSNTLEAAVQLRLVVDSRSLLEYTWDVLLQTVTSSLPFVTQACILFQPQSIIVSEHGVMTITDFTMEEWSTLDRNVAILTTSQVSSRASCLQGSGTLRAFSQTFPQIAPIVKLLKQRSLRAHGHAGHYVTCFGAICGLLGVDPKLCSSMFLYTTARDMINAAVRINMVGPLEGGRLINELCHRLDDLLDKTLGMNDGSVIVPEWLEQTASHQVAPLIEVLANAHDRLYTRLFNS